jgi:ribonuclease E
LHILRILEEEAMKDNTAAVHTQVPVDVATFLLNEKRADIQAIELRHKVNILLIPNIHLETPQHSIVRLRHDELNQDDLQQPSYKMVDVPTDEANKNLPHNGEAKAPRQEAAIKGITPEQPAPIVAERPKKEPEKSSGGFISKIISWFKGSTEVVPEAKPERKPRSNGQRDGRRGGRNNNRRDEERDNREARPSREPKEPREQKPVQTPAKEEAQKPREPRRQRGEPRQDRKEKEQQAPLSAEVKPVAPPPVESTDKTSEDNANGGSRRRGRRGGRRDRGERTETQNGIQAGELASASTEAVASPETASADTSAVTPTLAAPVVNPVVTTTIEAVPVQNIPEVLDTGVVQEGGPSTTLPEPIAATQAVAIIGKNIVEEKLPETEAQASISPLITDQEAPEEKPANPMPLHQETVALVQAVEPRTTPVENHVDIDKALEASGLVMVETSGDKIQSWQPEASEELVPRARRRRPAVAAVSDEPLVMVETRNP